MSAKFIISDSSSSVAFYIYIYIQHSANFPSSAIDIYSCNPDFIKVAHTFRNHIGSAR